MTNYITDFEEEMFEANLELENTWLQTSEDELYNTNNDYFNDYDVQQSFYENYEKGDY